MQKSGVRVPLSPPNPLEFEPFSEGSIFICFAPPCPIEASVVWGRFPPFCLVLCIAVYHGDKLHFSDQKSLQSCRHHASLTASLCYHIRILCTIYRDFISLVRCLRICGSGHTRNQSPPFRANCLTGMPTHYEKRKGSSFTHPPLGLHYLMLNVFKELFLDARGKEETNNGQGDEPCPFPGYWCIRICFFPQIVVSFF